MFSHDCKSLKTLSCFVKVYRMLYAFVSKFNGWPTCSLSMSVFKFCLLLCYVINLYHHLLDCFSFVHLLAASFRHVRFDITHNSGSSQSVCFYLPQRLMKRSPIIRVRLLVQGCHVMCICRVFVPLYSFPLELFAV